MHTLKRNINEKSFEGIFEKESGSKEREKDRR